MLQGKNQPILVTGCHRGGTTWVGKMIAAHPRVLYRFEPFNPDHHDCPVDHPWHYVTADEALVFRAYLRPFFELRTPCWQPGKNALKQLLGRRLRALNYLRRRWLGYRPLVKDPMALMSAEWLADEYQPRVLVLSRHPASFISSLKRLGWHMRVESMLEQEALMRTYLTPFSGALELLRAGRPTWLDRAILGWRMVHHVIRILQERRPDWMFCRHEDLSERPIEEFQRVFDHVGLALTPELRSHILAHSNERNPSEAGGVVHQLKRNSKANIWNWQQRLTAEEIQRIRRETEELAEHFYGDQDWWSRPSLAA